MKGLGYPVYSADSHVIEPPGLWTERIEAGFRHWAPRVVRGDETDLWVVGDDVRMAVVGIQAQAGRRYETGPDRERITKQGFYREIGELDPDRYVRDLDVDGVGGALLFPSNAHQAYRCVSGDLLAAIARAYNGWALEFCGAHPDRLKAVAMLDVGDVPAAAAELARAVAAGAPAGLIPVLPMPGPAVRPADVRPALAGRRGSRRAAGHACRRQPGGAGPRARHRPGPARHQGPARAGRRWPRWCSPACSRATRACGSARSSSARAGRCTWGSNSTASYAAGRGPRTLPVGELPSDHLRRNVFLSFQDRAAMLWRRVIGVENLLWGNDYPHAESTFPGRSRSSRKRCRAYRPSMRRRSSVATLPASSGLRSDRVASTNDRRRRGSGRAPAGTALASPPTMLFLVLSFTLEAAQPEPQATATLSADGQYDVRIVPDVAWLSAEITVDGNATDVGPQQADVPFDVTGLTGEDWERSRSK